MEKKLTKPNIIQDKTLSKWEMERNFLNLTKNIYKPLQLTSYWCKKDSFLLRPRTRDAQPLSPLCFSIILEVLAIWNERRNKLKIIWIKNEINLSLFIDKKTVYGENIKELTKKLLELISNYRRIAVYKANRQKLLTFWYTNNEQMEFEIINTLQLTLVLQPPNF